MADPDQTTYSDEDIINYAVLVIGEHSGNLHPENIAIPTAALQRAFPFLSVPEALTFTREARKRRLIELQTLRLPVKEPA